MAEEVFIYDAVRVPSGKKGGYYKDILGEELSAFLINQLIERNGIGELELEVLLANSIGGMGNSARYSSLKSLLPKAIVSSTIDFQCGGSYQTLRLAKSLLSSGDRNFVISGGMESNSLIPTRIYHRNDPRYAGDEHVNQAKFSPYPEVALNEAARNLAKKYNISKVEMSDWTVRSHEKAKAFSSTSLYKNHILPYSENFWIDQTIRKGLTIPKLESLATLELIDRTNTADFHDGAGLLLLSNSKFNGRKPMARLMDVQLIGLDPNNSPEGCIVAAELLMQKNQITQKEIDIFEVNESYACKPLAFAKHFNLDLNLLNIFGGNLAMGHPYAASGVLNLINLICALKASRKRFGLVSAGIAGGFGAAILIENIV